MRIKPELIGQTLHFLVVRISNITIIFVLLKQNDENLGGGVILLKEGLL